MDINNSWIKTQYIAHRGLFNNTDAPENSLKAFEYAIARNYAIELDVHVLADNTVVVFHDYTLVRMTGKEGRIEQLSFSDVKNYKLKATDQTIPTLKQVFDLVKGKVPILIEIKSEKISVGQDEQHIFNEVKNYSGQYAIQSFNPLTVKWFYKNAPHIYRGLLSSHFPKDDVNRPKNMFRRWLIKSLILKNMTHPNFIAYNVLALPYKKLQRIRKGLPLLVWTVTSQAQYDKVKDQIDNIIFQDFIPKN